MRFGVAFFIFQRFFFARNKERDVNKEIICGAGAEISKKLPARQARMPRPAAAPSN